MIAQSKLADDTRRLLRCPVCRAELMQVDEQLVCMNPQCGGRFPVLDGVPVLINEENSLFSISEFTGQEGALVRFVRDEPGSARATSPVQRLKWLMDERLPTLDLNLSSHRNYVRFARLLLKRTPHPKVLVVGGQILGKGMERIINHPSIDFVSLDVSLGARTTLVGDAHDLPFADDSFDGVVIQAVLHYLPDSDRVVGEIHRVLKVEGLVYSEAAFLQQVSYSSDFTRVTHVGQRRLFRKFEEIDSGIACGPGMALAWSVQYFLLSFVRSMLAKQAVIALSRLSLFWLKYFDYYLVRRNLPGAYDAASGYYFLGRKSHRTLSDREAVKVYRGNQ